MVEHCLEIREKAVIGDFAIFPHSQAGSRKEVPRQSMTI
jgi:hypothetical protein